MRNSLKLRITKQMGDSSAADDSALTLISGTDARVFFRILRKGTAERNKINKQRKREVSTEISRAVAKKNEQNKNKNPVTVQLQLRPTVPTGSLLPEAVDELPN